MVTNKLGLGKKAEVIQEIKWQEIKDIHVFDSNPQVNLQDILSPP